MYICRRHFIRVCTVCIDEKNLQEQKHFILKTLWPATPKIQNGQFHTYCIKYVRDNPSEWKGLILYWYTFRNQLNKQRSFRVRNGESLKLCWQQRWRKASNLFSNSQNLSEKNIIIVLSHKIWSRIIPEQGLIFQNIHMKKASFLCRFLKAVTKLRKCHLGA